MKKTSPILFVIALIFSTLSSAQRVLPMVFELEPSGARSSTSLHIENTRSEAMTVEFVASKLLMNKQGVETLKITEEDFLIFPPQAIIQPGKFQTVRVKYIGNPSITESKAYRVSVKQLPVDLRKGGQSGVGMLINFNTLVNITPKSSKAMLEVSKIEQQGKQWKITILNKGDRFSRLSTTQWLVSDGSGKQLKLGNQKVGAISERNLILPNSEAELLIPAFEGFNAKTSTIKIISSS